MTNYKNKSFKQETKNNQPIFLEKNEKVRAKKHLGQHFLNDENIAQKIADTLSLKGYRKILEIGSGMGILTKYLLKKPVTTFVIEIDQQSVTYLQTNYKELKERILNKDFLRYKLEHIFNKEQFAIIGNFPYNISTQIVFKMLEYRSQIPEFSGMFQKEVAKRICEKKGTKNYGILSVLVQAFYDAEYLFTVNETVFSPPPKVKSGVLHLKRKENYHLSCDEHLFFIVVKTAFNQRRKTLRNSLKSLYTVHKTSTQKVKNIEKESEANDIITDVLKEKINLQKKNILDLRPEQIDYIDFITLTNKIKANEF